MKIKNILIAGGTGELGNSLTEYLKDKDKKLSKITKKFCVEEKEHLNLARKHDTGSGLFHTALKFGIKKISKAAIKISEKI